jgi:hypothetical protein
MPLTETDAAAIQAGAQLAGTTANMISAANANKKQRQWQTEQYNKQREHALQDWEMQNRYNSPEEQMRRLKQAGLNPNLVYGQGAVANNSTSIRSSNAESTPMQPMRVDAGGIGEAVNTYFNVMMSKQEMQQRAQVIDNLKKQGEIMDAEVQIKRNDILNSYLKGQGMDFDLNFKKDARNTNLDTLKYKLQNAEADVLGKRQKMQYDKELFPLIKGIKKGTIMQLAAQTAATNQKTQLDINRDFRESIMQQQKYNLGEVDLTYKKLNNKLFADTMDWKTEGAKLDMLLKNTQSGKESYNLKNLQELGIQPGDGILYRILMNMIN